MNPLRFFLFLKDVFADAVDQFKLLVIGSRIEALNEDLDWSKRLGWAIDPKDFVLLDLWSESYNEIRRRIQERDAKYELAVTK